MLAGSIQISSSARPGQLDFLSSGDHFGDLALLDPKWRPAADYATSPKEPAVLIR